MSDRGAVEKKGVSGSSEEKRMQGAGKKSWTRKERWLQKRRWKPVWGQRIVVAALVSSDALLALAIWGVAYWFQELRTPNGLTEVAGATIIPSIAAWLGLRALLGLYPGYGLDSVERLKRHTYSVFAALAMLAVFALGFQVGGLLSRLLLILSFVGLLFLGPFVRLFVMLGLKRVGLWGKPIIVLSYKDHGTRFIKLLEDEWGLGYNPAALFDYNLLPAGESFEDTSYQETLADATGLARSWRIDTAVFAMPYTRRAQLANMVGVASESFRHVLVVPNLAGVTNSAVIARDFAGTFAVEIKHNLLDLWAQRLKRALDLFVAGLGGLLISPLLLTLYVLVRLDSPGPALFVQKRPGKNGEIFTVFKFRTMHTDAEERFERMSKENPALAEEFERHGKLREDPRVTRVGRWMRKFSLDELPQLANVLRGEMSLVGPRPYLTSQRSQIKDTERFILRVPPGITGLWQVGGRSDTTLEERVGLDEYYVRNWSVWLDIIVLARTVRIVLLGSGAY